MKSNRLIITGILIITGSFFMNLSAQEALKAVVKKCENTEGVKVSIIKSQKVTKEKVVSSVINISFVNNEALKKEILAAFEKDQDQADQSIMDKESGKITRLHYRFGEADYSYLESKDGKISLMIRGKF
jgi:hypothetical protein